MKRALTIAGSDSGGGAGIQADLKTFAAHGVYGTSAITALTAQNTLGVAGVHAVPAEFVTLQIEAVVADIGCDAVKTGMLATAAIVEAVAAAIEALDLPNLVVDPVMVAKGGDRLLDDDAVHAMRTALLRLARVVTPNVPEAEVLAGMTIDSLDDMRDAGRRILDSARRRSSSRAAISPGRHGRRADHRARRDAAAGPRLDVRAHARHGLHVRGGAGREARAGRDARGGGARARRTTWPAPCGTASPSARDTSHSDISGSG